MHIKLTDFELRQAILGGTALLLILVHMVAPSAGVDAVSLVLLVFLAAVLYGDEITVWMARMQERRLSEPKAESELQERLREVAFKVEHARIAARTEQMSGGAPVGETLEGLLDRAAGEPRAALLLIWGALEDRLRATGGPADALQGARRLAEQARVPRQFVEALDAYQALRNDVARTATADVPDELLWSLIDVGAALLALVPAQAQAEFGSPGVSR